MSKLHVYGSDYYGYNIDDIDFVLSKMRNVPVRSLKDFWKCLNTVSPRPQSWKIGSIIYIRYIPKPSYKLALLIAGEVPNLVISDSDKIILGNKEYFMHELRAYEWRAPTEGIWHRFELPR